MQIDAVRRFNRFYTRRVGALRAGLLGSPHPLPEARLVYEIGQRRQCSAGELAADLDLDATEAIIEDMHKGMSRGDVKKK